MHPRTWCAWLAACGLLASACNDVLAINPPSDQVRVLDAGVLVTNGDALGAADDDAAVADHGDHDAGD
jgi:hypothetical protein